MRLGNALHTVVGLTGPEVELKDVTGGKVTLTRGELFADPGFQLVTAKGAPLPPPGLLEGVPQEVVDQARWWERHIVEVLTGSPPQTDAGTAPRPEYDMQSRTLRQRELAKVEELCSAGPPVALRTFQRNRRNYETGGLWGLVDARFTRQRSPTGRTDQRVVEAPGVDQRTHPRAR